MSQFSFIVTLVSAHNVLTYTKSKLQGSDIARAHCEITHVKETLGQM